MEYVYTRKKSPNTVYRGRGFGLVAI
jgi:hypothetical protein